jgi:lipopolysaccharide/colanic/teichoic acid biosynthesis glycosyltransferase
MPLEAPVTRATFFVMVANLANLHDNREWFSSVSSVADGKVTRCGAVLRRSGLDELPQLVNVARGEMRLVGPRPLTAADVARLEWDGPDRDARWQVPPGLTGYAQLAPVCDRELSWSLDDDYAHKRSLGLDARILGASALGVVLGRARAKQVFWR